MTTRDLTDPTVATLAVAEALRAAGIAGAVYGGLALGAYGEIAELADAIRDHAIRERWERAKAVDRP